MIARMTSPLSSCNSNSQMETLPHCHGRSSHLCLFGLRETSVRSARNQRGHDGGERECRGRDLSPKRPRILMIMQRQTPPGRQALCLLAYLPALQITNRIWPSTVNPKHHLCTAATQFYCFAVRTRLRQLQNTTYTWAKVVAQGSPTWLPK